MQEYLVSPNHVNISVVQSFHVGLDDGVVLHPDHLVEVGVGDPAPGNVMVKPWMYFPRISLCVEYNSTVTARSSGCHGATSQLLDLQF